MYRTTIAIATLTLLLAISCQHSREDQQDSSDSQPTKTVDQGAESTSSESDAKEPPRDCSEAIGDAEYALSYLSKAANSEDIEEARDYARKAYNSFEDAGNGTRDCGCDEADITLSDASRKARHARDAEELDELWDLVRQAKRYGDDALAELETCND